MTGLYHSAKGTTWNNHKYTDKITKNGKTRYMYDQKTDYSGQLKSKLEELGLPESVISEIEDFYNYIDAENIQSTDQLKEFLQKAVDNSGAKFIESSDVDKLFTVAEKITKGNELTKNDYLDIAELSAKINIKDFTKIKNALKSESEQKQNEKDKAYLRRVMEANRGKPAKVTYINGSRYLRTDKVSFGKKVYQKLKTGAEKVSDITTDLKIKGVNFLRKLLQ